MAFKLDNQVNSAAGEEVKKAALIKSMQKKTLLKAICGSQNKRARGGIRRSGAVKK